MKQNINCSSKIQAHIKVLSGSDSIFSSTGGTKNDLSGQKTSIVLMLNFTDLVLNVQAFAFKKVTVADWRYLFRLLFFKHRPTPFR